MLSYSAMSLTVSNLSAEAIKTFPGMLDVIAYALVLPTAAVVLWRLVMTLETDA